MAEVLGRGTIEIVADARKLKAGIEEAKKSIRTLGEGQKDISKAAAQSIDRYIGKLQQQAATLGKTTRETELYKLALRGASNEQIKAADSALKLVEANERHAKNMGLVATGLRAVAVAAGAAAVALGATALRNIDLADKLNDLSKSTGISVENLAGLKLLADQTGTELEGLARGMNKLSVEIGKNPEKFRALGITAKDSLGQFQQMADVFNKIEDVALRNALVQKAMGKSWQELAPALSEGSKRIGEIVEKGTRLSGMTTKNAQAADEFNDKLAELKISSMSFGSTFIPELTRIVELLIRGKELLGEWAAAVRGFRNSGEELGQIEARLKEIAKQREERASENARRGPVGQFFSGFSKDLDREAAALERRLDKLKGRTTGPAPELGSHLTPAQDAAVEAKRIAEAKKAAAAARSFVDEGKDKSDQIAKAKLALDLENIRNAGEAQVTAFGNAERVMEAMRAAALVSDRDYYASKLSFIKLNEKAQVDALNAEIKRLKDEKFAGDNATQDKLNNLKAIADAEAKIKKIQADAATAGTVIAIQQTAANDNLTKSYEDAKKAADDYIDTITKRNQRELAGIGQGTKARERLAALGEIEDKRTGELQRIERERQMNPDVNPKVFDDYAALAEQTYRREVEAYEQRTAAIDQAQSNWMNGAKEALQNYADEAKNIAKQTEDLFTKAFQGLEDALVEFANTGKLNFKSLATSIAADINRMAIKQNITGPLAEWMKGATGEGGPLKSIMDVLIPGGLKAGAGAAAGAAGKAAEGTAFSTAVTAAGTTFSSAVTASGTALTTELSAAGVTMTTEVATAGATFSAEVIAAGSAFAASVAAASTASAAGSAAGNVAIAALAEGTPYVPQTGLYQLHQGERVVSASDNRANASVNINMPVNFAGPQNERTVAQGMARAGRLLRRELSRGTAA